MTWANTVHLGDSSDMSAIPDESIDALVTDPPYGLSDRTRTGYRNCLAWIALQVHLPKFDERNAERRKQVELPLIFGETSTLHGVDRAIDVNATVDVPIRAIDLQRGSVVQHEVDQGRKAPAFVAQRELRDVIDAEHIEFGGDYEFDLGDGVPAFCEGVCGCYRQLSSGRFAVPIIIAFDAFSARLLSPDDPSNSGVGADDVRPLNDSATHSGRTPGVVTGSGAEKKAVLCFDLARGTVELDSAGPADERTQIRFRLRAKDVGTSPRAGGLPTVAEATAFREVSATANGTRSLHRLLVAEFVLAHFRSIIPSKGFMGKEWDGGDTIAFSEDFWRECLRVMKPGAHLVAFGGTRTYHHLASAIERAGFEIRDQIQWLYGSGFPKSLSVEKAIDKHLGAQGTFGEAKTAAHAGWIERGRMRGADGNEGWQSPWMADEAAVDRNARAYIPATDAAREWTGWGTALKPAAEPIVLARKPLSEKNVAANVIRHGTGALNIDASRIGNDSIPTHSTKGVLGFRGENSRPYQADHVESTTLHAGRWPANVVLSHTDACEQIGTRTVPGDARADLGWNGLGNDGKGRIFTFPEGDAPAPRARGQRDPGFFDVGSENGDLAPAGPLYGDEEVPIYRCALNCPVALLDAQGGVLKSGEPTGETYEREGGIGFKMSIPQGGYGDTGTASRFFYVAKPAGSEKNAGVDDGNSHPTVKPTALMCYLIRMICPPGGVVLDPFAGSGTTLVAAESLGFRWVGYEREPEYHAIAMARLAQRSLFSS